MDLKSWVVRGKPGLWLAALAPATWLAGEMAMGVGAAALAGAAGLEGYRWMLGRAGLRMSDRLAAVQDWSGSSGSVQVALGWGRAFRVESLTLQWTVGQTVLPAQVLYRPDGLVMGILTLQVAMDPLLVPPTASLQVALTVVEGSRRHTMERRYLPDSRVQGPFVPWIRQRKGRVMVDWDRFGRVQENG